MPSTSPPSLAPVRMLIVNPNTSSSMTEALEPMVRDLRYQHVTFSFFTSPKPGVASINCPDHAEESAEICFPHLLPLIPHHDAFLVACYSQHPLVGMLRSECVKLATNSTAETVMAGQDGDATRPRSKKYVNGIFEASVTTSLSLLPSQRSFGIVSTAKAWEDALTGAVHEFLGTGSHSLGSNRYVGCETTGLTATELHDLPASRVEKAMKEATMRLLKRGEGGPEGGVAEGPVQVICLGCAGMTGLDDTVREACVEVIGGERARGIHIIDGVKAGVTSLLAMTTAGF